MFLTLLLCSLAQASPGATRANPPSSAPGASRPRLAVVVMVDQMVPAQLDRLAPYWSGGLGRFARQGRRRVAELDYANSVTAPGHASLSTGVTPRTHGIVENEWHRREFGRALKSVADPDARRVSSAGESESAGSSSARWLLVPGLADHLELAFPGAKSVAISSKDRGSILLAGLHPDLALWWDAGLGEFVSSDWYTRGAPLPDFARNFNRDWRTTLLPEGSGSWTWSLTLPANFDPLRATPDDQPGENAAFPGGRTFPHVAPALSAAPTTAELARFAEFVYDSPLGDQFTLELAREAVRAWDLGQDETPDLLLLSLSSCDTVGHRFGPTSLEVTDVLLRADRLLGELFAELDERVGAERWIGLLSADHGVLELPEILSARGIASERLPWSVARELERKLRKQLEESCGIAAISSFDGLRVYLDRSALEAHGADLPQVRAALAATARAEAWVARAHTSDELEAAQARTPDRSDALLQAAAESHHAERSPDLMLYLHPFQLPFMPAGTTHGSPYEYDRRVPLVFLGAPFAPEKVEPIASTLDALPTLLHALGVPVPEELPGAILP